MSPERFEHLLRLVAPYIVKKMCRTREHISPEERLTLTLRHLATGDSQQSMSFSFRVGRSTVSACVRETCDGIWNALKDEYLRAPSSTENWTNIANEFEEEWNFPHCLGAIDGKHIAMECPKNGGSAYFNYKNFHSIVLMAVCDAKYCFTLIDVGGFGRDNDAGILSESSFGQAFEHGQEDLNLPQPNLFKNHMLPYVLVGDDIFPLRSYLMKPFPGKYLDEESQVYNYRLSRARRTIENAFGVLAAKWRIFRKPIRANVTTVEKITKAALCLHNYLKLTENANYVPSGFVDSEDGSGNIIPGDWRTVVSDDQGGMLGLNRNVGNRYKFEAGKARNDFKNYFNSPEGEVPWQLKHVRSCGQVKDRQ